MSWIDNLNNQFSIITGDGQQYTPLWIPLDKEIEFNYSEFNFNDVNGSLIKRTTIIGNRYNLEFYFQGEDHLSIANSFEFSALDKRPWQVSHPYYGLLNLHPTSLKRDNKDYNITRFTGTLIETLLDDNPRFGKNPKDKISEDSANTLDSFTDSFDSEISNKQITDIKLKNDSRYKTALKKVKDKVEAVDLFNAYNKANSTVNKATQTPIDAIRQTQAFINQPSLFSISVYERLDIFYVNFKNLSDSVVNLTTRSDKKIYENNQGTTLVGIISTIANPLSYDFKKSKDILKVIEDVKTRYKTYLDDLDTLQSDDAGTEESYIPDFTSLNMLNDLINFALSNLFNIALGAKQERIIELEKDTNIVELTHLCYGLSNEDAIDEIIQNNDFGLNDLILLKKGTLISYYV